MPDVQERFNPADFPQCLATPLRLKFRPWIEHIPFAMALIEALRPRTFVELGTFAGDSYCSFCQAVHQLKLPTRCFAVDTWRGDPQAGPYGPEFLADLRAHHDPLYAAFSTLLQMTFDEARPRFETGSIDLLHIDGLHTYEAVKHDLENYFPALSDRAVILLHDVSVRDEPYGVWQLWEELAAKFPHFHFTHNNGLGVIGVGKQIPPAVRALFNSSPDDQVRIRGFFERLGSRCTVHLAAAEDKAKADELIAHLQRVHGHAERTSAHYQRLLEEETKAHHASQMVLDAKSGSNLDATAEIAALAHAKFARSGRRPSVYTLADLQPLHDLARTKKHQMWEVIGPDPHFLIPCYLPTGWMHLELDIETDGKGPAELFIDTGDGFTQTDPINLGSPIDGRLQVSTHFPIFKAIRALRFDPQTSAGTITFHAFAIRHLTRFRFFIRAARMIYRRRRAEGRLFASFTNAAFLMLKKGPSKVLNKTVVGAMAVGGASALAYRRWVKAHEITPERRSALEHEARALSGPLISVLMPVYNTPEKLLRAAIESVRAQVYPRWELCIVDDRSTDVHVRQILTELAAADSRIRVIHSDSNGGISAASNAALDSAKGEFVALLDHDDELAPQALLRVATEIGAHPDADIFYSDEDKLLPDGQRAYPLFKPGYAPEYLLACNYICHLGVYRISLLHSIKGFRPECDGAQDYDLFLRASLKTSREKIHRIADVLYHWRITENSTAGQVGVKPKAHNAGRQALQEYIAQAYPESPATIEPGEMPTWHRVRFAIKSNPLVSIIIPSKCNLVEIDGKKRYHLEHIVNSILEKSTWKRVEILSVDRNLMPADLAARLAAKGVRRITYDFDFNWSRVNNLAADQAGGDHLLFLNDDTEVISPDWLEAMLEYSQLPGIGAVGAKLLWPNRRIQHAGVIIFDNLPSHAFYGCDEDHADHCYSTLIPRNYSAVTGACLMTRTDVFRSPGVGGFNEEFPLAYNDTDYCLRIWRAGKRVVFTPYAKLFHFESQTRSPDVTQTEIKRFLTRWPDLAQGDPFYNPNLSKMYLDFRVAEA